MSYSLLSYHASYFTGIILINVISCHINYTSHTLSFNSINEQIARVAVGLCQIKPELADVIKAEYYRICPLTVPRQAEGGLVGDDMFDNMGFLKLRDTGGWEDSQQWLVRMNKVLCTFSVTLIQPEGAPFGLSDGWAWLSNMINACSRYVTLCVIRIVLRCFILCDMIFIIRLVMVLITMQ